MLLIPDTVCSQFFSLVVSDAAAVGVSSRAGMKERETCDMHYGDKVGQSANIRLVQSRRNIELNSFPEWVSLMENSHKVGTFFSYINLLDILHGIAQSTRVAQIRIQVDLNETRIDAQHRLLFSIIRYMICLLFFLFTTKRTNSSHFLYHQIALIYVGLSSHQMSFGVLRFWC